MTIRLPLNTPGNTRTVPVQTFFTLPILSKPSGSGEAILPLRQGKWNSDSLKPG